MKVIAKTSDSGYLLEATGQELIHILNAIHGMGIVEKIKIGQKVPAIDYASTITKIKDLKKEYQFKRLIDGAKGTYERVMQFQKEVNAASEMFDDEEK